MNDSVADMITRIKNAQGVGKDSVTVSFSKLKLSIAEVLQKGGFIKGFAKKGKKINKSLEIELLYENKKPKVRGANRVSKLSRRVYQKSADIRKVRHGYGMTVFSTPKGVLSGADAVKEGVGGEALFNIW